MSRTSPTIHRIESSSRLRIPALDRTMAFDRKAFREFQSRRARSMPIRPAADIDVVALTPWDMIDDEASEEGVTFARFQYFSAAQHSGN